MTFQMLQGTMITIVYHEVLSILAVISLLARYKAAFNRTFSSTAITDSHYIFSYYFNVLSRYCFSKLLS